MHIEGRCQEMRKRGTTRWCICLGITLILSALPAQASTTEVHVVKFAYDGVSIINETMVNYSWMRDNLPVMGAENLYTTNYTHHYFQGPTFDENNLWDHTESINVDSRDYGAVAGTDIKDLCELVGGMSPGDEVKIKSLDGFHKWFNYINVYNNHANETLNSRQGPMVLAWYNGEDSITGELQGVGYPDTGYHRGMRLHFFADNSTNPWIRHVFGLWDMHECLDERYWHYYDGYPGFKGYPSSSGLSVYSVNRLEIYSRLAPSRALDTGTSATPYPSISGTYRGTITVSPAHDIAASRWYTYPCPGTGGHTEFVRIENSTWNITASWEGYRGEWHNLTFDDPFTLRAGETYNYTITTGSYPQVIHTRNHTTLDGSLISCTEFVDTNNRRYTDWIPAMRLE